MQLNFWVQFISHAFDMKQLVFIDTVKRMLFYHPIRNTD